LTHGKDHCRACVKKRTAKSLYRAKCRRVRCAVRFHEKRTAKALPCVSCPAKVGFPVVTLLLLRYYIRAPHTERRPSSIGSSVQSSRVT
jgi:hypothetical protein